MKTKRHFYFFNAFRLMAALIVLTSHARCELFATYSMLDTGSQNYFTKGLFAILSFTPLAMSIFFILSGFLVGGPSIEKLWNRLASKKGIYENDVASYNFMINRAIRITPPLLFAIIFAMIVKVLAGTDFSFLDAFLNLLGLQGVCATDFGGVYWSIAYEVWFYVLIGSILSLEGSVKVRTIGVMLLAICGLVFIKLDVVWLFMILFGMLMYFVKDKIHLSNLMMMVCIAIIIISQGIILLGADSHVAKLPLNGIVNLDMLKWIVAISSGLIMVSLCSKEPHGKVSNFVEFVGNKWAPMTYCLYITHFTVLELWKLLFGQIAHIDMVAIFLLTLVCIICLIVGYMFYKCIEEPIAGYLKPKLYKKE